MSYIMFRCRPLTVLPSSGQSRRHARSCCSQFGDRDGVLGRDSCADEDENPGLSQPQRSETSFFQDFFSVDGTTDSSAFFAL